MIDAHLPALVVCVPLLAAPAAVLLRQRTAVWLLASAVGAAVLAMSIRLLVRTLAGEVIEYDMGGWAGPWGIVYHVDVLNALVLTTVSTIGAVVLPYAWRSVREEISEARQHFFYAAFLLCLTGLLGITITGDAFNVFVFLEIMSLSSYTLIAMGRGPRALTASYRYLVMGTIGGTFILLGIGLIYMMTGTLNMMDMAARLRSIEGVTDTTTIQAAIAFLSVGLGIKIALAPLHMWLPAAYTYAPSTVSAFLSSTATKVVYYVALRFFFCVFGTNLSGQLAKLHVVLLVLAIGAMFGGSLIAIFQKNVKRLLAYSSVGQIGYLVLGMAMGTKAGLTGGIIHLFNHALMKCGLFLVMGCVVLRVGSPRLVDLRGLGKRMPMTALAFVLGGVSLIGVPLTVGFVSKWYLVLGALERGFWWLAALILLASLLAVVYVWRVVEAMYFQEPDESVGTMKDAPLPMLIPTWIMVGATVVFGVWPAPVLGAAGRAAALLLGGTP